MHLRAFYVYEFIKLKLNYIMYFIKYIEDISA